MKTVAFQQTIIFLMSNDREKAKISFVESVDYRKH